MDGVPEPEAEAHPICEAEAKVAAITDPVTWAQTATADFVRTLAREGTRSAPLHFIKCCERGGRHAIELRTSYDFSRLQGLEVYDHQEFPGGQSQRYARVILHTGRPLVLAFVCVFNSSERGDLPRHWRLINSDGGTADMQAPASDHRYAVPANWCNMPALPEGGESMSEASVSDSEAVIESRKRLGPVRQKWNELGDEEQARALTFRDDKVWRRLQAHMRTLWAAEIQVRELCAMGHAPVHPWVNPYGPQLKVLHSVQFESMPDSGEEIAAYIDPKAVGQDNFWDVLSKCVPNILDSKRQKMSASTWHKLLEVTPQSWDALQRQVGLLIEQAIMAATAAGPGRTSSKEDASGQSCNAEIDLGEWENDVAVDAQTKRKSKRKKAPKSRAKPSEACKGSEEKSFSQELKGQKDAEGCDDNENNEYDDADEDNSKDDANPLLEANPEAVLNSLSETDDGTVDWTVVNRGKPRRKASRHVATEQERGPEPKQADGCAGCPRVETHGSLGALESEAASAESINAKEPNTNCLQENWAASPPTNLFGYDELWGDGDDGALSTITDSSSGHQSSGACSSERAKLEQAKLFQRNAMTYPGPRGLGFSKAPGIPTFEAQAHETPASTSRGRQLPVGAGRQPPGSGRQSPVSGHGTPAQTDYLWLGNQAARERTLSDSISDQFTSTDFSEQPMTAQQIQLEAERNLLLNSFTDPGPKGPKSGKNGRMWMLSQQLNSMRKASAEGGSKAGRIPLDSDNLSQAGSSVPPYDRGWLRTPSPEYRGWLSGMPSMHTGTPGPLSIAVDGARPMAGPVGPYSEPQFITGYPPYPQAHATNAMAGSCPGLFPGSGTPSQAPPGLEPSSAARSRIELIFDNNETQEVDGLAAVLEAARLPKSACTAIENEVKELGAIDVRELTRSDWEGLRCWKMLKVMEQRRVLAQIC